MVARRLFTAFAVSLSISAFFTWWIARRVMGSSRTVTPVTQKRWVVTASEDVAAGEVLRPAVLKLAEWAGTEQIPGSFTKADAVAGHATLVSLKAGEILLAHDVAPAEAGSGLAARLPIGRRALTIPAVDIGGETSFLAPGSVVDVLATYRPMGSSDPVTATVLQGVHILGVGNNTDPNATPATPTPATAPSVTLLVKPEDAQRLMLSASLGKLVFLLRNGSDRQVVENLASSRWPVQPAPADPVALLAPLAKPAVVTPHLSAAAPGTRFTIETIAGNKTTEESFGSVQR